MLLLLFLMRKWRNRPSSLEKPMRQLYRLTMQSFLLQHFEPIYQNLHTRREREGETFFLFRLCEQATYIIRAQDTVTALLQVQTIEGVGQLGGLKEL